MSKAQGKFDFSVHHFKMLSKHLIGCKISRG